MKVLKIIFLFLFAALLLPAQQSRFFETNSFRLVLDSMNFPEGPAYDGKGSVFISSCYGGFIKRIEKNKISLFIKADTNGIKQTNGLTFNKEGVLFACDFGQGRILSINKNAKVDIYASGYDGKKFNRPNDLAFDSNGNLFFSDPKTSNIDSPDGRVFMINKKPKK